MTRQLDPSALAALLQLDSKLRIMENTEDVCAILKIETALMRLHMKESVSKAMGSGPLEEWTEEVYSRILARAGDQVLFGLN